MSWLLYPLVSLVSAVLGLFCGGALGSACVRWYRISSFEGGSGYFVALMALAGALVGFVIGFVTLLVLAPRDGTEYMKAAGSATGILAVVTLLVAAVAWWAADIPPTVGGRRLHLEVELRLPAGVPQPVDTGGGSYITLQSVVGQSVRAEKRAFLDLEHTREEDGRWIVPGSIELFTTRGQRGLDFQIDGKHVAGFLAPVPPRPREDALEWSAWLPQPREPHAPWPADKPSFRFRLQPILPPPPPPSAEEVAAAEAAEEDARFAAIDEGAPLAAWLAYTDGSHEENRRQAALQKITAREDWVAGLGEVMRGADAEKAMLALRVVRQLPEAPDELVAEVAATGRAIAEQTRAGVAITAEQDPDYAWAAALSLRFNGWFDAALALRERRGADFAPELAEILKVARARPDSYALRMDVVRVASYYLQQWAGIAPLPTDPPPR